MLRNSLFILDCCWRCSITKSSQTLCDPTDCSTPDFSWSLLRFMSIELVVPSSHLILCHPLFLLPSVFPSITVFSNELAFHIRWPEYWSFSFSTSPSNEYLGLISFRIDCFDLFAVQVTLKSLLQHHSSKHQFFSTKLSLRSNSHIHTWLLENHSINHIDLCW